MVFGNPSDVVNADSGGAAQCIQPCYGVPERPASAEVVCSSRGCSDQQTVDSLGFSRQQLVEADAKTVELPAMFGPDELGIVVGGDPARSVHRRGAEA